ncbi:MAG: DUF5317 domain-containing protein [Actinomycetota bacterium]
MRLIAATLLAAVALGVALGGRPGRLSLAGVRWAWAALVGLALQAMPLPARLEWLEVPMLYASFALLVTFALANARLRGFELIALGLMLNFLVIGVNAGMPVSRRALVASDQIATLGYLERYGGAKHHLAGAGDRLSFLGDVIAIPSPIAQAISPGDVFTYAGAALFVILGMTGRLERRPRHRVRISTAEATDG